MRVLSEKYTLLKEAAWEGSLAEDPWWYNAILKSGLPLTFEYIEWLNSPFSAAYAAKQFELTRNELVPFTPGVLLEILSGMEYDWMKWEFKKQGGGIKSSEILGMTYDEMDKKARADTIKKVYTKGFLPWKQLRDAQTKNLGTHKVDISMFEEGFTKEQINQQIKELTEWGESLPGIKYFCEWYEGMYFSYERGYRYSNKKGDFPSLREIIIWIYNNAWVLNPQMMENPQQWIKNKLTKHYKEFLEDKNSPVYKRWKIETIQQGHIGAHGVDVSMIEENENETRGEKYIHRIVDELLAADNFKQFYDLIHKVPDLNNSYNLKYVAVIIRDYIKQILGNMSKDPSYAPRTSTDFIYSAILTLSRITQEVRSFQYRKHYEEVGERHFNAWLLHKKMKDAQSQYISDHKVDLTNFENINEGHKAVTEALSKHQNWDSVGLWNLSFFNEHVKKFLAQFDRNIIPFLVEYISELDDKNMSACYNPNDKDPNRSAAENAERTANALFTWYIITYQQYYDFIRDTEYYISNKAPVPENIQIKIRDETIQVVDKTIKEYMDKFLNDKTSNTYKKWEVHLKIQAAQRQNTPVHKVDLSNF